MACIDSRFLTPGLRLQSVSSFMMNVYVIIMRRQEADGHVVHDGEMGTNTTGYVQVAKGWPCSIVPTSKEELSYLEAGQTEIADYTLTCQFLRNKDGGLVIRERDVVINMTDGSQYLVMWAHDTANSNSQITAGLRAGVVNPNLAKQG